MGRLTHTVSGDVASFRAASHIPLESLKFHFLPKQEGSGDPSPTNIRPITGWTGLNGRQDGKNLIDINSLTGTNKVWWKGSVISGYPNHCVTPKIPVKPGVAYRLNRNSASQSYVCYFDKNGDYVDQQTWDDYVPSRIIPDNVYFVGITIGTEYLTNPKPQFELGTKATGYANYINPRLFPVAFPVYTKNLFNPRCPMITNQSKFSLNGDKITQTGSDDRGWKDDDRFPPINLPAGTYTLSCSDGNAINFMTSVDGYTEATRFNNGVGTFTIGENVGIKFKHTASSYPAIFTIQIESGNQVTDYVPFLYGGTWFGGHYDPVVGELVYSWRKFKVKDYEWTYKPGNHRFQTSLSSGEKANASGSWTNFAISDSYKQSDQQGYQDLMVATYSDYYIYIRDDSYENADDFVEARGEVEIAYELANPIHIPISAQDMKAFLDHNNFWSDANDITEVTYEVTESKDILATRKRAMMEESGHHRIVNWNQIQVDGNFQDIDNWEGSSGYNTISISDGVMTCTCTTQPTQFYQTGFRTKNKVGFLSIPYNHKILVSAYLRCSTETRIRIYGLVSNTGNTYIYQYNQGNVNVPANTWTRFIGFIGDRPETPPSSANDVIIKRFKPCIVGKNSDMSTIPNGTTFDCKNFMAFDLTQMFGLGNEPQTVAEFERICVINGIDLTTYQPYDAGSDRWLIIP